MGETTRKRPNGIMNETHIQKKIDFSRLWRQDSNGSFVSCGMEVLDWHESEVAKVVEAERERIRVSILSNRGCRSHEPENCEVCQGRQEALEIIAYPKQKGEL